MNREGGLNRRDTSAIIDTASLDVAKVEREQNERAPLEERISRELRKAETIEQINAFPEDIRNLMVGEIVEYCILMQDSHNIDVPGYMNRLQAIGPLPKQFGSSMDYKKAKLTMLIQMVTEKLALQELESNESKEKIYSYFANNFIKNGYLFHSFNGAFEENIRSEGLDPNKRIWDQEELDDISGICAKAGEPRVLGWENLNSRGQVSLSDNVKNLYNYGLASPEWFAQFVSEGFHIPIEEPYDKKAYYKQDYKAARRNIELLCERISSRDEGDIKARKAYPNITETEKEKILAFFERHWKMLVTENSQPKCALIKRSALGLDRSTADTYAEYSKLGLPNGTNDQFVQSIGLMLLSSHNDLQLDKSIPLEEIKIVSLPEYNSIHNIA